MPFGLRFPIQCTWVFTTKMLKMGIRDLAKNQNEISSLLSSQNSTAPAFVTSQTHILVPVGGYDVPVGGPEALDLPGVDLVLVEVGHVLGDVELRDGDVVQVLAEAGRVGGEELHAAGEVREAAVQVVKVEVAGLKKSLMPGVKISVSLRITAYNTVIW